MSRNSSMWLDYKSWLEKMGLDLLPAVEDDTLILPPGSAERAALTAAAFNASKAEPEPEDIPVTPVEPEPLEPKE